MDDPSRARPGRFTPEEPCRNCGDATVGKYCPSCGQAKRGIRVSVRTLVADLLEDQLVLDRALPRTLSALLLRPGFLTMEYARGRIVRYVAPFRLYLACSVVFFLVFSVLGLRARDRSASELDTRIQPELAALDSARAEGGVEGDVQPWARNLELNIGDEETNRRVRQRVIDRFGHLPMGTALRRIGAEYVRYVPHMIFVLLPLFAALLKLLYVRSGRYFAEHFVFSLHVHAFVFAVLTLMVIARWLPATLALLVGIGAYVWAAMKRVYGQGWFVTTLKAGVLGASYSFALMMGLVATLAITLLML